MSNTVIGIDLGTTFSAVAWVDETGRVEMIPNGEGETLTPSVVLVENGRFVVGRAAVSQAVARPGDIAICIKCNMGDATYKFQSRYTPEEISAAILHKLVCDAQDRLRRPVTRAVITVPAYFTAGPLAATRKAAEMAGVQVEDLLDEPEAAAIHFAVSKLNEGSACWSATSAAAPTTPPSCK